MYSKSASWRAVAMILSPRASTAQAMCCPSPEEQPVTSHTLDWGDVCGKLDCAIDDVESAMQAVRLPLETLLLCSESYSMLHVMRDAVDYLKS